MALIRCTLPAVVPQPIRPFTLLFVPAFADIPRSPSPAPPLNGIALRFLVAYPFLFIAVRVEQDTRVYHVRVHVRKTTLLRKNQPRYDDARPTCDRNNDSMFFPRNGTLLADFASAKVT